MRLKTASTKASSLVSLVSSFSTSMKVVLIVARFTPTADIAEGRFAFMVALRDGI
jgi:hypothetical protein